MRTLKIILAILTLLVVVIFILSLIPFIGTNGGHFEKNSFSLTSCHLPNSSIATWDGQKFYTQNEPDHKYLDELKSKFIESGISENYFDNNIKLIYSNEYGKRIEAWFIINTNSWLDRFSLNQGYSLTLCQQEETKNCDLCKPYATKISGLINLDYGENIKNPPIVYSILGKLWHDDRVVDGENIQFHDITNVLSPWEAGLITKKCIPISWNKYMITGSFEYVVNGEDFTTLFDPMKYKQARINLLTGKMECNIQQKWINPGPPSLGKEVSI